MNISKTAAVGVLLLLAAGFALFHRRSDPERVQVTTIEEQHSVTTPKPTGMTAEEGGGREKEHHELMRLRDEVGRFRREAREMTNGPVSPLDLESNANPSRILQVLRDNDPGQEAD